MKQSYGLYRSQPDEYGLIPAHYASDGAYDMARRQAKAYSQTYEEMGREIGFKMHFHLHLPNHDPAKVQGVLTCIAAGKEFILYSDKKNYTIFIPEHQLAICYKDGEEYTQDVSETVEDWQDRVKMAMMGYDHFYQLPKTINAQPPEVLQLR